MTGTIIAVICAMGIPTGVTGFCFWAIERKITTNAAREKEDKEARRKEVDKREQTREEYETVLLKSVEASLILSEATARAVQRIPDAKCNGDMDAALEKVAQIRAEKNAFMSRQTVKNIF